MSSTPPQDRLDTERDKEHRAVLTKPAMKASARSWPKNKAIVTV